jgi:hypothetical protein
MGDITRNSRIARAVGRANGAIVILSERSVTSTASKVDEIAMVLGWTVEHHAPSGDVLEKDRDPQWVRDFREASAGGRPILLVVRDTGDAAALRRFITVMWANADLNSDWGIVLVTDREAGDMERIAREATDGTPVICDHD